MKIERPTFNFQGKVRIILDFLELLVMLGVLLAVLGLTYAIWDTHQIQAEYYENASKVIECGSVPKSK